MELFDPFGNEFDLFESERNFNIFFNISLIIITIVYCRFYYEVMLKKELRRIFLRRFYNAVCNLSNEKLNHDKQCSLSDQSISYWFEQLNLNYKKLCQDRSDNLYTSILDLLETIIYYYDSYSPKRFRNIFGKNKDPEIKKFLLEICDHIKSTNPYISVPAKEADLMRSISEALNGNNKELGITALKHLSQEIENKEKLIIKQKKENQKTTIISIIGIILTILFGILSIL